MPADTHLEGTAHTNAGRRTTHNFTDQYAQQWMATLDWMRKQLRENAAGRDRTRTNDKGALSELRAHLAAIAGPDVHRSTVRQRSVLPGAPRQHYLLELENGVRYAGSFEFPSGEPPKGVVYVLGSRTPQGPGSPSPGMKRADAFLQAGFAVVTPFLALETRSLTGDPQRRWYAYDDDELLHFLGFILGTSLAGMEAVELSTTVRTLADLPGLPSSGGLPVALALEGRTTLSGLVAAALEPQFFDAIVLFDDLSPIDHQELDRRSNTLWGVHTSFDSLTLLQLADEVPVLFAEEGATPSAPYARALAWFAASPRTLRRCRPEESARVLAEILPASGAGQRSEEAIRQSQGVGPWRTGENLTPNELYLDALTSKAALLERMHGEARRRRLSRRAELRSATAAERRAEIERDVNAVMGPPLPRAASPNPRTCRIPLPGPFDAYQVLLESVPGIDVAGYLLIPHGQRPFPAVICQHGLLGRPDDLVGLSDEWIYYRLARVLAEKEYVVFVPFMNWGWGGTPARDMLAKHAYALGITPNRFEVAQLHTIVDFLQSRPEVDGERIAFYGLSYGGHASLWLGAMEPRLAAVVTAGHFNCWYKKLTSTETSPPQTRPTSYISVEEGLDMFTWNVLNRFDHAELATLNAPRPYMVENGLRDTVSPVAWVEEEFAEVRQVYTAMGAPDKAALTHFDGPHRIWGEETLIFLDTHLKRRR